MSVKLSPTSRLKQRAHVGNNAGMAAVPEFRGVDVVDLRKLGPGDLEPVLAEENISWRAALQWDYSSSVELVRRYVRIQALSGYALMVNGEVAGYSYYVCEDRKALIGGFYILREHSSIAHEDALLSAVLKALFDTPQLRRIEAQLLMMRGPFERQIPYSRYATVHPREFMVIDLNDAVKLAPGRATETFDRWDEHRQDDAAQLIAWAYSGHVDASINDQYRSLSGAKRFLQNIVQYPGCGSFFAPGAVVARRRDGRLCGISLASLVASDVGHITQICVAPDAQRTGIGYELMRRSLNELARHGCEKTSLTVTSSNQHAIQLYQRMGFRSMRRFAAYVWEGF